MTDWNLCSPNSRGNKGSKNTDVGECVATESGTQEPASGEHNDTMRKEVYDVSKVGLQTLNINLKTMNFTQRQFWNPLPALFC